MQVDLCSIANGYNQLYALTTLKKQILYYIVIVTLILPVRQSFACSCGSLDLITSFRTSHAVFIGKVQTTPLLTSGLQKWSGAPHVTAAKFLVSEGIKAVRSGEVIIVVNGAGCGPSRFESDKEYLVFATNLDELQTTSAFSLQQTLPLKTAGSELGASLLTGICYHNIPVENQTQRDTIIHFAEVSKLDSKSMFRALVGDALSEQAERRYSAVEYFERFGSNSLDENHKRFVDSNEPLRELLYSTHTEVLAAGLRLFRFQASDPPLQRILELSKSSDHQISEAASDALKAHSSSAKYALDILAVSANPTERALACESLWRQGVRTKKIDEALLRLLNDSDKEVRAKALEHMDKSYLTPPLTTKVISLLSDPEPSVQAMAVRALWIMRNPKMIFPLYEIVKTKPEDEFLRYWLLTAIYNYSEGGEDVFVTLIDQNIDYFIGILKQNTGTTDKAVRILRFSKLSRAKEAIRWAAENHKDAAIKGYAQKLLGQS